MIRFLQEHADDPYVKTACTAIDVSLSTAVTDSQTMCSKIEDGTVSQEDIDSTDPLFTPERKFFYSLARSSVKTFTMVNSKREWFENVVQSHVDAFLFGLANELNDALLTHLSASSVDVPWIAKSNGKLPCFHPFRDTTMSVPFWSRVLRFYDVPDAHKAFLLDCAAEDMNVDMVDFLSLHFVEE